MSVLVDLFFLIDFLHEAALDINMPKIFESKSLGSICTLPSDKTIWVKADVYIRGSSLDNWISGIRVAIVLKDQSSAASKRLGP